MSRALRKRFSSAALFAVLALWAASCAAPLGPGFTVERQGVAVAFLPGTDPRIEVHAEYRLRNTGNRPLDWLDVRLPPADRVRLQDVTVQWDRRPLAFERQSDPAGDVLRLRPGPSWPVKRTHTLHLEYHIISGAPGAPQLDVASDGFYLPADGWLAVPLPPGGTFASGGQPPKEWTLSVRVPADFLVRASGEAARPEKAVRGGALEFAQSAKGLAPYVVAGRYFEQEYGGAPCPVHIWKKTRFEKAETQALADAVHKVAMAYEEMLGPRDNTARALWVVESPLPAKHDTFTAPYGRGEIEGLPPAPPDFVFLPGAAAADSARPQERDLNAVAESLARTWTGYGLNPGYDRQLEPLNSLSSYAAWVGREALEGPRARTRAIRESLESYDFLRASTPQGGQEGAKKELGVFTDGFAFPPKTLLFYFALEDQFGREKFHKALRYMVQARRWRGYNLDDLIAALESETHQNVAEFVRLWRKHPGIPGEFRARYTAQAQVIPTVKETKP